MSDLPPPNRLAPPDMPDTAAPSKASETAVLADTAVSTDALASLDLPVPASAGLPSGQVLELLDQMERQLAQVRLCQQDQQRHFQSLHEQAQALTREADRVAGERARTSLRRLRLERVRQALRGRRRMVHRQAANLQQEQRALAAARQALDEARQESEQRTAWVEARCGELAHARQRLAEQAAGLEQHRQALEAERAALEQRGQELGVREAQVRQTVTQAAEQVEVEREHLRRKEAEVDHLAERQAAAVGQLACDRQALALRRRRLQLCRRLTARRVAALDRAQERTRNLQNRYRRLLEQRRVLLEVRKFLTDSEAAMMRRWATARTVSLLAQAVITLALLGAAAWFAAQQAVAPVWEGQTVLRVQPPAADESPSAWADRQRQALFSGPALHEALAQLGRRGQHAFGDVEALRQRLATHLHVQARQGGHLALVFRDADPALVRAMLESVGWAAVEQQRAADHRAGRPVQAGIAQPASVGERPAEDRRLAVAGGVWAGLAGLWALAGAVLRLRHRRASPIYSPEASPALASLDDDHAWPEP